MYDILSSKYKIKYIKDCKMLTTRKTLTMTMIVIIIIIKLCMEFRKIERSSHQMTGSTQRNNNYQLALKLPLQSGHMHCSCHIQLIFEIVQELKTSESTPPIH